MALVDKIEALNTDESTNSLNERFKLKSKLNKLFIIMLSIGIAIIALSLIMMIFSFIDSYSSPANDETMYKLLTFSSISVVLIIIGAGFIVYSIYLKTNLNLIITNEKMDE